MHRNDDEFLKSSLAADREARSEAAEALLVFVSLIGLYMLWRHFKKEEQPTVTRQMPTSHYVPIRDIQDARRLTKVQQGAENNLCDGTAIFLLLAAFIFVGTGCKLPSTPAA